MSKPALTYVIAVLVAATGFATVQLASLGTLQFTAAELAGAAAFVFVGFLSQAAAIDFGSGRQAASSMAFIPLLAAAIVFPPQISIVAAALVIGLSELFWVRTSFLKSAFNVGQIVLALGIGAVVYSILLQGGERDRVDLLAFLVLVSAFFGINIVLSSIALALYRGHAIGPTLRVVIGPRGGNFFYDVLASPAVILTVKLFVDYGALGILMSTLPLLMIRHFYLSRKKLADANRDLLTALIKAIETRDPYTSGHSLRVATLARLIAKDLALSHFQVEEVFNAALLHDVGKIDPVYSVVISKPHQLTPEERALIQTHAVRGAELLRDMSSVDARVVAGVRHHHERYDGTGYPDGLRGTNIPLTARIIMLCDSIDAMLSDRPYRAALTIEQVKAELIRCAGYQFDPVVVNVVLRARTLEKAVSLVAEWGDAPGEMAVAALA